jgi:endonuclease/exonuclease/phosphatase family metal-dependent hydrolase
VTYLADQSATFTLMSYNIFLGGAGRMEPITSVVRDVRPDLLGIQEADDEVAVARLADAMGMDYVYGMANTIHHVAFLSRLPIVGSRNHPHPGILRKTMLEVQVRLPNSTDLTLFVIHLNATATIGGERRRLREMDAILQSIGPRATIPHLMFGDCNSLAPGDTVVFKSLTAHYANRVRAKVELGAPRRERQMTIGALLDRGTRSGLFVGETLLPRHLIRQVLDAGYVDCYRYLHPDEPGYTFPAPAPAIRLDYMFAPAALRTWLLSCDVVDLPATASASDHRPLLTRFVLPLLAPASGSPGDQ